MESYYHGLTEHAEAQKEPDYGEIQKRFGWRVVRRLNDILSK